MSDSTFVLIVVIGSALIWALIALDQVMARAAAWEAHVVTTPGMTEFEGGADR